MTEAEERLWANVHRLDMRLDAIERFIGRLPGAAEVDVKPIRAAVWAEYGRSKVPGTTDDKAAHLDACLKTLSGN